MKDAKKNLNHHVGHRERLREKFDADRELTAFQDHEILEYLLSLVIPRKDTNELAHEIMNKFGSLHNVFMATPAELKEFKNMTVPASYLIAGIYPAVRRSLRTTRTFNEAVEVGNYSHIAEYMQPKFIGRKTECVSVLYLSPKYKIIFNDWIEGSYSEKIRLDGEAITKRAVKEGAKYVIFAHNHPSQELDPSYDDITETSKIYGRLASVGVELLDSLIFSDTAFVSFRSLGIMDQCDRDYYEIFLTGRSSLQSPKRYEGKYFKSQIREFVLNYNKLKMENEIKLEKSDFPLTPEGERDPRNKD